MYYEIHGVAIPVKVAENGLIQIDYCYMIVSLDGSVMDYISLNRSEIGATCELYEKKEKISKKLQIMLMLAVIKSKE